MGQHGARFERDAVPYLGRLYAVALQPTGNQANAEDLIQEAFATAFVSFHRVRPGTSLQRWLFRILATVFVDRYRGRRRGTQQDPVGQVQDRQDARAVAQSWAGPFPVEPQPLDRLPDRTCKRRCSRCRPASGSLSTWPMSRVLLSADRRDHRRPDRHRRVPAAPRPPAAAHRCLAQRIGQLTTQARDLQRQITVVINTHAPQLLHRRGIGPDSAAALLIAAGDNPDRLHSDASFAALCGVSPIEASSGKTTRHRLNRGGDRGANAALYRIAFTRLRCDSSTRRYLDRRTAQGKTRREVIRCIKRYLAREIYRLLQPLTPEAGTTP
jgi:DNA-directed RNA polymerase specialized sigma24 family protein